ncbi:methyltransferase domain-containing protein [Nocardioides sp. dk4132]|nr:methyltransferase domain-containing protein [Nocardioides sp. dk4132]QGA09848.1 methyltransferase domain-containing protein [Nocardioides sp. dk884]
MRRAYDTVAADYAAHLPDLRAESALDRAMLDAFAGAVRGPGDDAGRPLVLDAGCGTGRIGRYLHARGSRVVGVDLSPGMVAQARRARPDLPVVVGSLAALPYADARFDGVLLWYSTIHAPPADQPRLLAEAARVLRPGGHLLVGFQSGTGTRDVAPAYRTFGHEIELERHLVTADQMSGWLAAAGLREVARLVRRAQDGEPDDQASVLAQRPAS